MILILKTHCTFLFSRVYCTTANCTVYSKLWKIYHEPVFAHRNPALVTGIFNLPSANQSWFSNQINTLKIKWKRTNFVKVAATLWRKTRKVVELKRTEPWVQNIAPCAMKTEYFWLHQKLTRLKKCRSSAYRKWKKVESIGFSPGWQRDRFQNLKGGKRVPHKWAFEDCYVLAF